MIVNLIVIFMGIVLVNNFVLSQFLGICSFLGVSNKMSSSVGMGGACSSSTNSRSDICRL